MKRENLTVDSCSHHATTLTDLLRVLPLSMAVAHRPGEHASQHEQRIRAESPIGNHKQRQHGGECDAVRFDSVHKESRWDVER